MLFACLLLVFCTPSFAAADCGLGGHWVNQRNSTLLLKPIGPGMLSGQYRTAVGNASGTYTVVGSYEPERCTLGFCVTWNNAVHGNSQSSTCWVGEEMDGHLRTMYVHVYGMSDSADSWRQYTTNVDIFDRA